ncbi:hypothetical protein [Stigmatella aurantiaca]|nr:hypothetical protein [Stigmatella aurantiaca]
MLVINHEPGWALGANEVIARVKRNGARPPSLGARADGIYM